MPDKDFDDEFEALLAESTRAQPDVIINLPESRHLVIDAKISIVAYNDYANSDNDLMKDAALISKDFLLKTIKNSINLNHWILSLCSYQ